MTAGGTFVEVSAERLVGLLEACGKGVEARGGTFREERAGAERVFVLAAPGRPAIRVYSSLGVGRDTARDCGADAIRVVIGVETPEGWRACLPPKRVFRTAPRAAADREAVFLERLRDVLRRAWTISANVPRCPECSAMMSLREGKHGDFWGCLNYPRCRGTRKDER